jgi:hypothetical protein
VGPRSEIRDIERHEVVRARGPATPGLRRGLNARGLKQLREMNRPVQRYNTPSSVPLTQMGWAILLLAILLLVVVVTVALLVIR